MLLKMGQAARQASYQLAKLKSAEKNQLLGAIADLLEQNTRQIIEANSIDIKNAQMSGLTESIIDRLLLTPERLSAMANDVRHVAKLKDPVGQIIDGGMLDSGLRIERRRVPLGVVGVIYEARPNVTVDIAALCLKTGNASILRGGKETINTNKSMVEIIQSALQKQGIPAAAIQAITDPDRTLITELLKMDRYIDILIPRGGAALHKLCSEQSTIPVITGGIGVCHMYIDESADIEKALPLIVNAKTQRPSTCNTLETLLINKNIAAQFVPELIEVMAANKVILHVPEALLAQFSNSKVSAVAIKAGDYNDEWLSLDLNIAIVADMDAAINHIRLHGSAHSDAILTRSIENADRFITEVDSAAVYVNASTRFTDGAQFGLGAEVAVSTQKLHVRGPMGLEALTTYKWIGYGQDSVRK